MTRQDRAIFFAPLVLTFLAAVVEGGTASRPSSERSRYRDEDRYRDNDERGDEWFRDRSRQGSVNGQFPSEEVRDAVVANAQAVNARAVAREAETALDRAVWQARRNFDNSREYKEALEAERAAYIEYQAARNRALRPLNDDPRYQAIMSLRNDLTAQLASAQQAPEEAQVIQTSAAYGMRRAPMGPVRQEIVALATARMNFSADARLMENQLVRSDERVREVRERLSMANARASGMRAAFDDALRTDPELLEVRKNLEQARIARVTSAAYSAGALSAARRAVDFAYYTRRADVYFGYGSNMDDYSYGYGSRSMQPYRYRY